MMQYYKAIRWIGDTENISYWKGDSKKAVDFFSKTQFDHVIPYGNRRPRNVAPECFMDI